MALLYVAAWHLSLWTAVSAHAWRCATAWGVGGGGAPASRGGAYWATVRGVLLLAAAVAHAASLRFFSGGAFADLARYASRSIFVRSWAACVRRGALALAAPLVLLGGAAVAAEGPVSAAVLVLLGWLPLLFQYNVFLTALQFCSLGLDAFALDILSTSSLRGLVARFDKLYAAMRRSAYHVQAGLTVFVMALIAALYATVYHLVFFRRVGAAGHSGGGNATGGTAGEGGGGAGGGIVADGGDGGAVASWAALGVADVCAATSVGTFTLLGFHLLNQIAEVNAKCRRLPGLIQSLNFGAEIDHDKWCVAEHIASLEAGFFIYNVPVTRWSVLKFAYSALAATSFLLTRIVLAPQS